MWASNFWGFVGITVSFLLVLIPADDPYWKAWVLRGAIFFGVSSFGLLAWPTLIRVIRHLSGKPSTLDVTASYDMPIAKAIDYIVNDSTQKLKRSRPLLIFDFGPAKGLPLSEQGAEHADAFRLLEERANLGDIRICGRRERSPINATPNPNFECILRGIDKDYWRTGRLDFFSCFHVTVNIPQTVVSNIADPRYTGLMFDSWQVRRLWKPKATLHKFFERKILKRPRLSYWSPPATLSAR